eukprot:Gb_35149 [translate_table: standard]
MVASWMFFNKVSIRKRSTIEQFLISLVWLPVGLLDRCKLDQLLHGCWLRKLEASLDMLPPCQVQMQGYSIHKIVEAEENIPSSSLIQVLFKCDYQSERQQLGMQFGFIMLSNFYKQFSDDGL